MSKYTIRHDKVETGHQLTADGKFALGVLAGVIATVVFFLGMGYVGYGADQSDIVELSPIIVSLLVAGLSAILSSRALYEQRRSREASTDPVLVAHFGQRTDARELMTFKLTNIGAGAALNIFLDITPPNDNLTSRNLLTNIFENHHPFAVITQGSSIEFSFAMGWNLLGEKPLPPFHVQVEYEDLSGGRYSSEFTLDVREMGKLGAERSPQMQLVRALDKIADNIVKGR